MIVALELSENMNAVSVNATYCFVDERIAVIVVILVLFADVFPYGIRDRILYPFWTLLPNKVFPSLALQRFYDILRAE